MSARRGPARRKARTWVRWAVMKSGRLGRTFYEVKADLPDPADFWAPSGVEFVRVRIVEVLPARSRK